MNIKITVNPYNNEKAKMLGYATVNFEDKYVLENIKIKDGQHGRYVELPKYSVPKKDDNGKVLVDIYGKTEFERKDIFHPITADMNKEFTEAILTEYKNIVDNGRSNVYSGDKRSTDYTLSGDFNISRTTAGVHEKKNENDNLLGMATMSFGNSFMLDRIKVKESTSEKNAGKEIIELPKYRTTAKDENGKVLADEYEYKDAFHAITTEGYNEMYNAVIDSYHNALAVKQGKGQEQPAADISQDGIPFEDVLEDDYEQSSGRR